MRGIAGRKQGEDEATSESAHVTFCLSPRELGRSRPKQQKIQFSTAMSHNQAWKVTAHERHGPTPPEWLLPRNALGLMQPTAHWQASRPTINVNRFAPGALRSFGASTGPLRTLNPKRGP